MSETSNNEELRIGVYICHCGTNIAGVIPPADVAEWASRLPGVAHATDTLYACADSGQSLIKEDIKKYNLNRVVVSACSVRMHETTFRGAVSEAGLNPFLMEMANIREQCTWAHGHDREGDQIAVYHGPVIPGGPALQGILPDGGAGPCIKAVGVHVF